MNMKNNIIIGLLLSMAGSVFCQNKSLELPLSSQEYLRISKKQKTLAWLLLGTGTVVFTAGVISGFNLEDPTDEQLITAMSLVGSGLLLEVSSISFFIASGTNKRRAKKVSTYLGLQRLYVPPAYTGRNPVLPAVTMRITF